jgi:hypothetical protein
MRLGLRPVAERMRAQSVFVLLAGLVGACNQASAGVEKSGHEKGNGIKAAAAVGEAAGPSDGSGAVPSCGSGGAECQMQRWMKANLQAFQRSHDYARLASAFEQLAELEPKGYDGWAESSRRGAEAAARKDEAGVSKSCETCHKAHRDTYRRTLRSQALSH